MTDIAKRKTLKVIAMTAAATASATLGNMAIATAAGENPLTDAGSDSPELANIDISTRISAYRNDLEVVLTNSGQAPVTITDMTPRSAVVPRGEFNFAALLADGPLHLQPGAEAIVPLRHRNVSLLNSVPMAGHSLADTLRKSVSVVTEGSAFASVTVHEMTALA